MIQSDRVTVSADQCGGVPCVRGLRIPVSVVISLLRDGIRHATILEWYPDLTQEDIDACIAYNEGNHQ